MSLTAMPAKAHTLLPRPPGPRGGFPGALLVELRRDILGLMTRLARDYGDITYIETGGMRFYFVSSPEYIRDVLITNHRNFTKSRGLEVTKVVLGEGLLTSEGEFHRRQRRLMQPAFHWQRIQTYAQIMTDYSARLRSQWEARGDSQAPLDIHQEMMWLTLAIVGKTLFNTDVEEEASEIEAAMNIMMPMFNFALLPFAEYLVRLPLPMNRRFERAKQRVDDTIYRIINEHRQQGVDQGDLVSMLLLAQDEEGSGGMTDLQVHDEALTIFLAGHETTAVALSYTWYLLAQHPEIEAKLHAEIDDVLGGRLPTPQDLPQLRYTEMVLAEAMRLYPPAYAIGRRAINDYQLGEYCVPAGATIIMSPWVMHRDAQYYPDPTRFDPERWTPEAKEVRPKFSYFPFGGGPRICIGEGFAWMEGVLLIATLAQQWQMRLAPDFKLALNPLITLRPKGGISMVLERRI
ncbi:MAG: cytochrome P450 [Abitibacteriaceae bacterium]|nr:cytochrome P450 [Abditibacteriaceae bacterium]MBV9865410.1 cytochrome P450 [Abditibacteriaceae bacterium]